MEKFILFIQALSNMKFKQVGMVMLNRGNMALMQGHHNVSLIAQLG
jgi:hypothetical protein